MNILLQNQSQLEMLKSSLAEEIEYHKEQIDDHEVKCSCVDNKAETTLVTLVIFPELDSKHAVD